MFQRIAIAPPQPKFNRIFVSFLQISQDVKHFVSAAERSLRTAHTLLALLPFATFIAHFSAALMHALIYRDGVFPSMASWKSLAGKSEDMTAPTIKRNAAK